MLKFAAVVGLVLWSSLVGAIRWEFDDGTTQGWSAKEGLEWGGTREFHPFPGEVDEGVWRIRVDPAITNSFDPSQPSVEVVSSTIGYDSSLFDRLRIRFRTVHDRPTEGTFAMQWDNASGHVLVNNDELVPIQQVVYTTEWQEVEVSLEGQYGWEGLLRNLRFSFILGFDLDTEVVEAFEIDWIELTGVEELLQGELPPPLVEHYFRFAGTGLFAPPVFYPIAPGIGEAGGVQSMYLGGEGSNVLTDLDGDGDLDLFSLWEMKTLNKHGPPQKKEGWLMALNDGHGALERGPVIEEVAATGEGEGAAIGGEVAIVSRGVVLEVLGADLTGDGQAEIVLSRNNREPKTEVWSIGSDLQVEVLVQIDSWVHSVADWDGDGRAELFVGGADFEGTLKEVRAGTAKFFSTLAVWEVEPGGWTSAEVAYSEKYAPQHIGDFTGNGVLDVFWSPIRNLAQGWIVAPLNKTLQSNEPEALQRGEVFEVDEEMRPLGVGDFDGDGQVDFLTEFTADIIEGSKGIVLQRKGAGDRLVAEVLYDDRLLRRSPVLIRDLNGDGVDDWVFIGGDRASGFGVFIEWGGLVTPTQDGERHRLTGSGRYVLSGDMDGDGDLDLLVLDPILGGVHLLKNSLASTATAVQTSAATRPAQYRLGDSYPNPFNPAVVLPLDLATDAATVSLRVHDVLGRRVRQVWQGPLGAGQHRFVWDGRDEAGKAVAAGVYVYRVEMDGRVEAKKTTKLP